MMRSEIVLAEAMAVGIPVVAIDAPGVREIVSDKVNGRLLDVENATAFANAIAWVADLNEANQAVMKREFAKTATKYCIERSAKSMLELYDWAIKLKPVSDPGKLHRWRARVNRIDASIFR